MTLSDDDSVLEKVNFEGSLTVSVVFENVERL